MYIELGPDGFRPISVVVQDEVGGPVEGEDAVTWGDGLGLTYPVLADVDGDFFPRWDPDSALPMAYIIDQDGVITWKELSGSGGLDEMESEVRAILEQ